MSAHSPTPLAMDRSNNCDREFDLLPVRMLNEYAYCPRLFHLMHVEDRWADNVYTIEGRTSHRRVDQLDHVLPNPDTCLDTTDVHSDRNNAGITESDTPGEATTKSNEELCDGTIRKCRSNTDPGDEPPVIVRSVPLDSANLGISAKLDLVSTAGVEAVPVETKRGRVPDVPQRCYEPERVQLMAQGLLLREYGYHCDHGVLYFAGSRTRVDVPFTEELERRTRELITAAQAATTARDLPLPLEDSPKCNGCSLSGICLPDETLLLRDIEDTSKAAPAAEKPGPTVRRMYPPRDDALPLYVQEQGACVGKSSQSLIVRKQHEELARVGLKDVSHVVLCGNISITPQTIQLLCESAIPIVHLSRGHWFYGITCGQTLRNAYDRAAQFETAAHPDRCLNLAKSFVTAKGANQRTMLRRNAADTRLENALNDMANLLGKIPDACHIEQLLGLEGSLAAHYFAHFGAMLKPRDFDAQWDFRQRNRRPPRDPVNALLSFAYAMLSKECTVAVLSEGLDPWWGFYHQPRHGRPALALDLMEEFRPLIADSAVITAINTGMVTSRDFTSSAAGCMLNDTGRKALIRAYEARLDQLVTHPVFDYRCSWRAVIRVQARLLVRHLRGDLPTYQGMTTR